jgi:hypothetical protein
MTLDEGAVSQGEDVARDVSCVEDQLRESDGDKSEHADGHALGVLRMDAGQLEGAWRHDGLGRGRTNEGQGQPRGLRSFVFLTQSYNFTTQYAILLDS